ncbi:MAG: hypothetical protein WCI94_13355 [Rhodospirillales bacterium]
MFLSVITGGAALAGLFQAIRAANEAQRQADAAQGQLRAMQDDQRPWLKVEVDKIGPLTVVRPPKNQPIPNDWPIAMMQATFKITNVGKAPAFNVRWFYWASVETPMNRDLITDQKRRCASVDSGKIGVNDQGFTIFPQDIFTDNDLLGEKRIVAAISRQDFRDAESLSNDKTSVPVYIYGCVKYASRVSDAAHHQTSFLYRLSKARDGEQQRLADIIFDFSEDIAGGRLRVDPLRGTDAY